MNVGTRVFDSEDDDPDEAVVVARPDGTTIADWQYEADGETYTTAESNPDYPADEQLVLISFLDHLEYDWPEWTEADPEELLAGVEEHQVPHFGFPEARLETIEEGETSVPEEFEIITERLEENGFEVTLDEAAVELHVEKYGTEYVVDADGVVEGEAGLRNRVTSIVNRYL